MITFALALLSLAPAEPASKAMTSLAQRTDASSFICIGTVDEVITVPCPEGVAGGGIFELPKSLEFARIRVERVIKGDPATKVLYHEAWPTWMCDTTRAHTGERSLFLLSAGAVAEMKPAQRALVESTLAAKLILRNVFSGDGLMPILGRKDAEYVHCFSSVPSMAYPDESYACRWKPALEYVATLAQFSAESVTLLAQRWNQPGSFDLRVLPDGRRRFASPGPEESEIVTVDRCDPTRWRELRSALESVVGDKDWAIGRDQFPRRQLRIRGERNKLEFFQSYDMDLGALPASDQPALVHSLQGWRLVRDALECDACFDDRESDRVVLRKLEK